MFTVYMMRLVIASLVSFAAWLGLKRLLVSLKLSMPYVVGRFVVAAESCLISSVICFCITSAFVRELRNEIVWFAFESSSVSCFTRSLSSSICRVLGSSFLIGLFEM